MSSLYILVNVHTSEPIMFEVDPYTDCELSSVRVELTEDKFLINGGVWVTKNKAVADSMVAGEYISPTDYVSDITHPLVSSDLKKELVKNYRVKELII